MYGWIVRYGWMDGWINGDFQINGWMDGMNERQIDR